MVKFLSDRSGPLDLSHYHNIVSSLVTVCVTVCPCQKFVLENCHETSFYSLIQKTGEVRDRTHDPWLTRRVAYTTPWRLLFQHLTRLSNHLCLIMRKPATCTCLFKTTVAQINIYGPLMQSDLYLYCSLLRRLKFHCIFNEFQEFS